MRRVALYVAVAVSGAAVLALEILGTRILGPFYGVSLYLWSALITVTLAALSLGYWAGGRLADSGPRTGRLAFIIGAAGVWVCLIPLLKEPILGLASPLGLRGAVLSAAALFFFPPLSLLGMVSPFAVKLRTIDLENLGRTAGSLYALSTLASVAAALLTGFFLIPSVGVTRLTVGTGALLLGTAGVLWFSDRKIVQTVGSLLLFLLAAIASALAGFATDRPDPASGLLDVFQSPYGEIRVLDRENGRHLLIDGGIHCVADTITWDSQTHYAAVMDIPKYFYTRPGSMLLIGLGGGSLLKQYSRERWRVDAVDIDPVVIRTAYSRFGLKKEEGDVTEMDGRAFLAATTKTYDVILLDAFGSSSIPFHLMTQEVFERAASRMSPDGILALNVESVGWHDLLVGMAGRTLRSVFPNVLALPMAEPPDQFGNVVLLASRRALVPLREPEGNLDLDPTWRYGPGYFRYHAWENRFAPDTLPGCILTDDLNPVELRAEAVNLTSRTELRSYFGTGQIPR